MPHNRALRSRIDSVHYATIGTRVRYAYGKRGKRGRAQPAPQLVLASPWVAAVGFPIGTKTAITSPAPGVLIITALPPASMSKP